MLGSLLPDRRALNGLQVFTLVLLLLNFIVTAFGFIRVAERMRDDNDLLHLLDTEIKAILHETSHR